MIGTCDVLHRPHLGRSERRRAQGTARGRSPVKPGARRRLAREIGLIAVLAAAYEGISRQMVQAGHPASSHALLIVSVERALSLFHEHAVQAAIIGNDSVTDAFNAYYGGTHFIIPVCVLAWLFFRHPAHYSRARTTLAVTTGVAFVCFWLFPVAPPRLLPARFGMVDTLMAPDGSGHFDGMLISTAGDKYASMPSLHVAWAVWCALVLYPVVRHWALRALAVAYPVMTTLVVVATGNHFFLDAIAGALLAGASLAAVTWAQARLTIRAATRRPPRRPGLSEGVPFPAGRPAIIEQRAATHHQTIPLPPWQQGNADPPAAGRVRQAAIRRPSRQHRSDEEGSSGDRQPGTDIGARWP